ncbi:MAG: methylenetetrahydrofolate--tRNA-(uracil(54)-C(5))-methyltransferase (FADH(2)-oxidizing) TrmFO [Armatimonadetes bacterium]|nr:methylenetetrahydrofolate--tRNA-(uracil(54)-C(5))-methyltransferase (FADH(2)-oxidizing) TrmFO [Armatimonadota bacterium]
MTERERRMVVIGGGLAGAEAAWQAAERGVPVTLYEMRPGTQTPAHRSALLAELVCSNSLKSDRLSSAHGVLKAELRLLGSLILRCADECAVPAGQALAVDRERFARAVTEAVEGHPLIEVRREEVTDLPAQGPAVVATGPLTSAPLAQAVAGLTGADRLYFYDALSPIVAADSIDMERAFLASRYGKGEADYINCPMTREEYEAFHEALVSAETTLHADYDPDELFEGCLPIEIIAARSPDGPRFGPMKPVGLTDPRTGERPWAVVQLRAENRERTMYNMVGFQTSLRYPEQRRVFRMIPGLERAEFLRYGAVHRNTYLDAPRVLLPTWQVRARADLLFAGQITGVEGYVESAGSGLLAGINAARLARGQEPVAPPVETMLGALVTHITTPQTGRFQPMNANFGLLPPVEMRGGKRARREAQAQRAVEAMRRFIRRNLAQE